MKKLKQETENERVERRIKELEEAELKEKYKDKPIKDFTVEHIGGLECAKCHY